MNENPSYYAILTAEVRYDKRLSSTEKLLYAEITALSSKTGECWASNTYFADLYGKSDWSISRAINNLVKYGYLKSKIEENYKRTLTLPLVKNHKGVSEKSLGGVSEKSLYNNTSINIKSNNSVVDKKILNFLETREGITNPVGYLKALKERNKLDDLPARLLETDITKWDEVCQYQKTH